MRGSIASVSFRTYPSLATLYLRYKETIAGLIRGEQFASVENQGMCTVVAPELPSSTALWATDESTWNHSGNFFDTYSIAQMMSVSTDSAMGRVFCVQTKNGSEDIVWTQDSGDLLGYATGVSSHEDVFIWWDDIHHHIIFPGQPQMSMTTSMSPSDGATGASGPPSTSPSTVATASGLSPP